MKDMLGVVVEEGDIILSCAATSRGLAKLGKVYGFNKNGYPLVQYVGSKYNHTEKKYVEGWARGEAGSHVLVIRKGDALPEELINRLHMDYDAPYVG
jgi:hypothetical protein